jgi:Putative zinc-finger
VPQNGEIMLSEESHLSDQEMLLAVDGELSPHEAERVESHLAACWTCRVRKQEIETAIGEFVRFQRQSFDLRIPPSDGPRALLKAQLAQRAEAERTSRLRWPLPVSWRFGWALLAAIVAVATVTSLVFRDYLERRPAHSIAVTVPNPSLTPGATVLLSQRELCRETNANNKAVSVALQRRVFDEYGIRTAEPKAYEVDYLITPALGGADDIHNLWPQSSSATVWNAQVKDALEAHLRNLVCEGDLDLGTAQREIATNWIEAYKKYFHTDQPVAGLRN